MKWFKHETDAHMNLKLQSVIDTFGLEGYGYYWACTELVGKESENYRIKSEKNWKMYFKKFLNIEIVKQEDILSFFAQVDLIDKKALQKGDLFLPKLQERSDYYTDRVRRKSVQSTDNVPLEEKRKEENRLDKKREEQNIYGEFKNVYLSEEEVKKLEEKIGLNNTTLLIEELSGYIKSNGRDKYKDHYATIQNWARRRVTQHKKELSAKTKTIA